VRLFSATSTLRIEDRPAVRANEARSAETSQRRAPDSRCSAVSLGPIDYNGHRSVTRGLAPSVGTDSPRRNLEARPNLVSVVLDERAWHLDGYSGPLAWPCKFRRLVKRSECAACWRRGSWLLSVRHLDLPWATDFNGEHGGFASLASSRRDLILPFNWTRSVASHRPD
jgi:hypothetical protein